MKKPTHQSKEMLKPYYHKLAESKGYTIHFPLRFSDVFRGIKWEYSLEMSLSIECCLL